MRWTRARAPGIELRSGCTFKTLYATHAGDSYAIVLWHSPTGRSPRGAATLHEGWPGLQGAQPASGCVPSCRQSPSLVQCMHFPRLFSLFTPRPGREGGGPCCQSPGLRVGTVSAVAPTHSSCSRSPVTGARVAAGEAAPAGAPCEGSIPCSGHGGGSWERGPRPRQAPCFPPPALPPVGAGLSPRRPWALR